MYDLMFDTVYIIKSIIEIAAILVGIKVLKAYKLKIEER